MDAKVLYAVLNWGLGHATRSVPVIKSLIHQGAEVYIASSGRAQEYLKTEFPDLIHLILSDKEVIYNSRSARSALIRRAFLQANINRKQHREIKEYCENFNITHIVSDNIYGAYHRNLKNALISHQLSLKSPHAESLINRILARWINKFTEIWIPDDARANLTGDLSINEKVSSTIHHLGILSRMVSSSKVKPYKFNIGVLLGGPEPQRSVLEEDLFKKLSESPGQKVIFRGTNHSATTLPSDWIAHDFGTASELNEILPTCQLIIARSGYSSVMDLIGKVRKILFVPTPGQTEQEYLAEYLSDLPNVWHCKQSSLNSRLIYSILDAPCIGTIQTVAFSLDNDIISEFLKTS